MRAVPRYLRPVDPATGRQTGAYRCSEPAEIAAAVAAARAAAPAWARTPVAERAAALAPLVPALRERRTELAELITGEMGKPITEALEEVDDAAGEARQLLDRAPVALGAADAPRWAGPAEPDARHLLSWHPVGVAAVIAPFNYPLEIALWGILGNLLCGNAVVFKPSELTPGTGTALVEAFGRLGLPPGLLGLVIGDGEQGRALVDQDVDLVWLVGSTATGRRVYAQAAAGFKRCVLELGGNSAGIVLDGAEVDDALLDTLAASRFTNAGQVCSALKRLFVQAPLYAEVVDGLAERVARLRPGDPRDPATRIGPLAAARAAEVVDRQVTESVRRGGRILVGGGRPGPTPAYYRPALLTEVPGDAPVLTEEVFGPVLPVLPFTDDEEAVALADTGGYGLNAFVFGDPERAGRIAERLSAGRVLVNATKSWGVGFPIEGWRASGLGRFQGDWSFWELSRLKYRKVGRP